MQDHTPLAPETIDSRRRYLCRHIFTDGHRCASPALRGNDFCYHHRAARSPVPLAGRTGMFTMPRIDDRAAIQIALYEVLCRISAQEIELKAANSLLYGLSIASSNLPRDPGAHSAAVSGSPLVEEITHDYHFGDLAPVVELPSDDPALPPAVSEASQVAATAVIPSECAARAESSPHLSLIEPATAPCPIHRGSIAMSGMEPPTAVVKSSAVTEPLFDAYTPEELEAEAADLRAWEAAHKPERIPAPLSGSAPSPHIIPPKNFRIDQEIHEAVEAARRRCRPPLEALNPLEPRTPDLEPSLPRSSLTP